MAFTHLIQSRIKCGTRHRVPIRLREISERDGFVFADILSETATEALTTS